MTLEREQRSLGSTPKKRNTQPLDVGNCICYVQRASVGEDHIKDCPLYRQRGSGISVLHGPREQGQVEWYSANGQTHLRQRKRKQNE